MSRKDYVDTRGIWPVYIDGIKAVTLVGKPLSITVDEAREVVRNLE